MSEYWISQGRRMCTYCKCWTADNKASIAFHEQGKNHKENVKRKLDELRKKGLEDARSKASESSEMEKIEKAALASLKKDLQTDKGMGSAYGLSTDQVNAVTAKLNSKPPISSTKSIPRPKNNKTKPSNIDKDVNKESSKVETTSSDYGDWTSAYNEEGHLYYWNTVTNETSWYPPDNNVSQDSNTQLPYANNTQYSNKSNHSAYGQWENVKTDVGQEIIDLDLPTDSKNNMTAPEDIPLPPSTSDFITAENVDSEKTESQTNKFKTKRVSLGSNNTASEPVAFKKRKVTKQRQARSNLDDE